MGKYSIDSSRFQAIKSQPGRYREVSTGANVSRARAIKETQGKTHTRIAREEKTRRIRQSGHWREELRRAIKKTWGSEKHPIAREAIDELERLWRRKPKAIRKGGTREQWARWNDELSYYADYFELDDTIDWDEFFADSPVEE